MLIGLVTEPLLNTRKNWFKRLFRIKTYKKIQNIEAGIDVFAVELPYSIKELNAKTHIGLERYFNKIVERLEKQMVATVLSDGLKELCQSKGILQRQIDDSKPKKLFLKLCPDCIRQTAKLCGFQLIDSVLCIRDTKMDRISEYLLRELCYDVNNIVVCTKNRVAAEEICERFYDETGLLVRVLDAEMVSDIIVDVDNAVVLIKKDLYIKSADLGYDFQGYKVNHLEFAQIINKKEFNNIKWNYSYE